MRKLFNKVPAGVWRFGVYIIFFLLIKILIDSEPHVIWVSVILSACLIVPEFTSDYSPRFLAYLFINKIAVIIVVTILCLFLFSYSYYQFDLKKEINSIYTLPFTIKDSIGFILEACILGYITRTLLIHYFDQIIRAREVFTTKILIMVVYLVMLLVFPFNHKNYICFYSLGFGIGFLVHYLRY